MQRSHHYRPKLILTAGEPAGIGPDLIVQLVQQPRDYELTVVADPVVLQERAKLLNLSFSLQANKINHTNIQLIPVKMPAPVIPGKLDKNNSKMVLQMLEMATDACLAGQYDALITAPVHKGVINDAGIPFTGHTEFLQTKCNVAEVVMLLTSDQLNIALVTTHLPLAQVVKHITKEKLRSIISILLNELPKLLGKKDIKIFVCGLNPHAGEAGHLGQEEITIIEPVLNEFNQQGPQLLGPYSADTIFQPQNLQAADVFLAMYHDQGLPVLKTLSFGKAANITLGLPFIRTSVDHGTALTLAGTGKAEVASLEYAIAYAVICTKR